MSGHFTAFESYQNTFLKLLAYFLGGSVLTMYSPRASVLEFDLQWGEKVLLGSWIVGKSI